jgi:hypothetical protein
MKFHAYWPFPQYEEIISSFPHMPIDEKAYNAARNFYIDSLEAEKQWLDNFIRSQSDEEQTFIDALVTNALHVGIAHTKRGNRN